jgi:hypothetical protein
LDARLGASSQAKSVVRLYGRSVGISADTADLLGELLRVIPGIWAPAAGRAPRTYSLVANGSPRRPRYVLYKDGVEFVRSRDFAWIRAVFAGSVGFYAAETSRIRTFVHAGVVGWRGRAIVVPGREFTGKTTLTAALVEAGATYLSDEFAPIDDRGRVHPFPRPLTFKRANVQRPKLVPVESLGGVQEGRALPVGLVVIAPFAEGKTWRPRPVSPGRGVMHLMANCASARTRPDKAFERLGRVATMAPVLQSARGEADETARKILTRCESFPPD